MNMNLMAEIYNKELIMIEDLCIEIVNKILNHLGMPSLNRSAVDSFDVELCCEENYNTGDALLHV